MDAREKFRLGQRVKLTEAFLRSKPSYRRDPFGVVVGFGQRPHVVRVQRYVFTTPLAWHADFWEPEILTILGEGA